MTRGFSKEENMESCLPLASDMLVRQITARSNDARAARRYHPEFELRQRKTIRSMILYYGITSQRPLTITQNGRELTARVVARQLTTIDHREVVAVAPAFPESNPELRENEEYLFLFSIPEALATFDASVIKQEGNTFYITFPETLRQHGIRRSKRVHKEHLKVVLLTFRTTRAICPTIERSIYDIGIRSFSFTLSSADHFVFLGGRINRALLTLPTGAVECSGVVRSLSLRPDSADPICAVEILDFADNAQRECMDRFVREFVNPRTRRADVNDLSAVWRLLVSSTYVDEAELSLLSQHQKYYRATWAQLVKEPSEAKILCTFEKNVRGNRHGNPLVATVSLNKINPVTWIVHHLCIDRTGRAGKREDKRRLFSIARDLYVAVSDWLQTVDDMKYWVAYFDRAKSWNDLVFGQFFRQYKDQVSYLYDRYTVHRYVFRGRSEANPTPRNPLVNTYQARDADLSEISHHLRKTLPRIEFNAFSYAESELTQDSYSKECATRGIEWSRRFFCAELDGRLAAFLIAETGPPAGNIFGLFDKCQLCYLQPSPESAEEIAVALLSEAIRHYRSTGRAEFLLLCNDNAVPEQVLMAMGLHRVAEGSRFIAKNKVLPAMAHHINEVMRMLGG